jgi:CBS-domain-containing membrane protein
MVVGELAVTASSAQSRPFAALIDAKFLPLWRTYLFQVGLATCYMAVALILVRSVGSMVVVTGIGASTFLVFCVPKAPMAQARNVFGGHFVAVVVTLLLSPLMSEVGTGLTRDLGAALAVGIAMLGMVVTNTEHAPAAGTALGFALQPWNAESSASILLMAFLLVVAHRLGKDRMINLL